MEVFNDIIQLKNSTVALGFFDGVHIGHQALINKVVKTAKLHNTKSVLITFKKSPAETFGKDVKYITNNKEKEFLISSFDVDYMIELSFNEDLMNMTALDYLKNVTNNLHPYTIITGFNHTFGKNKVGNPFFLKEQSSKLNYDYIEIPAIIHNNEIVSSTLIKKYLLNGDIENANQMLGHNFNISGEVIEGNKIGRTIGFPTANIIYPEHIVQIPFGVYRCNVNIQNKTYRGFLNYGIKPTIKETHKKPIAEVHIIDFNKDIYGENIEISILKKIRNEKKFSSIEELRQQINEDLKQC